MSEQRGDGSSAIWGGGTIGAVIGLIVGIIIGEIVIALIIGAVVGALLGLGATILAGIAERNRRF